MVAHSNTVLHLFVASSVLLRKSISENSRLVACPAPRQGCSHGMTECSEGRAAPHQVGHRITPGAVAKDGRFSHLACPTGGPIKQQIAQEPDRDAAGHCVTSCSIVLQTVNLNIQFYCAKSE